MLRSVFAHPSPYILLKYHTRPNLSRFPVQKNTMSTQQEERLKARHVGKVTPLQPTRNPTEVIEHKQVSIALHSDGYGVGVNRIDPRTAVPFTKYIPRDYDPSRDNMSQAAAAALTETQREAATASNVARFENERRRLLSCKWSFCPRS